MNLKITRTDGSLICRICSFFPKSETDGSPTLKHLKKEPEGFDINGIPARHRLGLQMHAKFVRVLQVRSLSSWVWFGCCSSGDGDHDLTFLVLVVAAAAFSSSLLCELQNTDARR